MHFSSVLWYESVNNTNNREILRVDLPGTELVESLRVRSACLSGHEQSTLRSNRCPRTAQRDILDLCPVRQQPCRISEDIPLNEIPFNILPFLFCLVRGSLQQNRAIADLGEHPDESERLGCGVANEVVELIRRENLVEDVSL